MADELINSDERPEAEHQKEQGKFQKKRCFVIMPISDVDDYEPGHFGRVYDYLIKPACEKAGFEAIRADKNQKSDFIVIDIIKQIVESDMAICDLSSRNPNVFYELGIRQAFDLKTVLIKDDRTARAFDISGIRTIDYNSSLRVDEVKKKIEEISTSIQATYNQTEKDGNSLIQLLAVKGPAKLPKDIQLGSDSSIILNEIRSLRIEMQLAQSRPLHTSPRTSNMMKLPNGEWVGKGELLYKKSDEITNEELGEVVDFRYEMLTLRQRDGHIINIPKDADILESATKKARNE